MKSSNHSGIPSPLHSPATPSLQFPVAPSSLRIFAGCIEIDRFCGGDVEEKVVGELDDSPRTTYGTKFSVSAEGLIPILGETWLTTIGPLISVTALFTKFAN